MDTAPTARPLSEEAAPVEISAVMPCLNEERTLETCIRKAQACLRQLRVKGEVIVADNGSSDRSREIATACGAVLVDQPVKGYGAALAAGFASARGDIIVMADADDSYDWANFGPFVDKIREGYDVVVGNRFLGGIAPGAMPWHHRYFGNPVLSLIARTVYRVPIGDFHCGMRAFRRAAYREIRPRTEGMEFATETIACAGKLGLRVTEVPTTLKKDGRERRPHLRSFRDGWRHLKFILTYAPDYLFLFPGLAMLALGVCLQVLLALGPVDIGTFHMGIHFLALGGLLSLVGFNALNMCVHSKMLLSLRFPDLPSRTVTWALERFRLDRGVALGGFLSLASLAILTGILIVYLRDPGRAMEGSVHLAIVSAETFALGTNIIFASFLLALFCDQHGARRS